MITQWLNKKQREAVNSPKGPLLIAAGAGSGKTKTLTGRLMYFLENGARPEEIIAITFTNKAAQEMAGRIANGNLQTANGHLPFIGTFHSLGARILKKESHFFKRTPQFTIFDQDDALSIVKQMLKRFSHSKEFGPGLIRHYISKVKDELVPPEELEIANPVLSRLLKTFFDEYELQLQNSNAFDFDDLIEKPVRLFRQNPKILENYQNRFKYILVDEFQDTNTSQYQLVKLLASKHKNISAVGDDQQSIYGFRGSDFRNFLNFENDWPEAKIVLLEENYRSTKNIISAASAVIQNNKYQKHKDLWTKNETGLPVKIIEHEDEAAEAEWIASEIQSSKIKNQNLSLAILYRTNAQSRPIEQALIERNIAYKIFGGVRFYERKEIKDIVAGLRFALNAKDAISGERLEKNFSKKLSNELRNELPKKSQLPPVDLIAYMLTAANYFEYLAKNYPNAQERIENIKELIGFASQYADLSEFLEKVALLQPTDMANSSSPFVVNLMTIHIAKGLEFDIVFVAGCNEGLLPHQMSYKTQEEIEEERRLMYVAMTRAKKELNLSFFNLASRFLYEIPPEFIEFKSFVNPHNNEFVDNENRYISLD